MRNEDISITIYSQIEEVLKLERVNYKVFLSQLYKYIKTIGSIQPNASLSKPKNELSTLTN